jgi:hypothetical protein
VVSRLSGALLLQPIAPGDLAALVLEGPMSQESENVEKSAQKNAEQNADCVSCRRSKANLNCELCESSLCKNCVQFLESDTFSFLSSVPVDLTHASYCPACFDGTVSPALEAYNETMERAKTVYVFFTSQKKEIPLIKKSKETIQIKECPDRDEVILRLGFMAAERLFNGIIEVEVTASKVQHGKHQKSNWRGTAILAQIDAGKMDRREGLNKQYRD